MFLIKVLYLYIEQTNKLMIFTKEKYLQAKRESKDVLQETGFTPRQLAEQKAELYSSIMAMKEIIDTGSSINIETFEILISIAIKNAS